MKLAKDIRDGKATQDDKLRFLQSLNVEFKELSAMLDKVPRKVVKQN